jgi:hypothetical protein
MAMCSMTFLCNIFELAHTMAMLNIHEEQNEYHLFRRGGLKIAFPFSLKENLCALFCSDSISMSQEFNLNVEKYDKLEDI